MRRAVPPATRATERAAAALGSNAREHQQAAGVNRAEDSLT